MRATLHALRDRLTVEEAAQFAAQLPMLIRGFYYEGWNPTDKPVRYGIETSSSRTSSRSSNATTSALNVPHARCFRCSRGASPKERSKMWSEYCRARYGICGPRWRRVEAEDRIPTAAALRPCGSNGMPA